MFRKVLQIPAGMASTPVNQEQNPQTHFEVSREPRAKTADNHSAQVEQMLAAFEEFKEDGIAG